MDFRPTGQERESTDAQESLQRQPNRCDCSQYDAGATPAELGRRHGVHANTIRFWKTKYGGMDVSDVARLKQLESENGQMHRIIAQLTLKVDAMEDLIRKNGWGLHSGKKQ